MWISSSTMPLPRSWPSFASALAHCDTIRHARVTLTRCPPQPSAPRSKLPTTLSLESERPGKLRRPRRLTLRMAPVSTSARASRWTSRQADASCEHHLFTDCTTTATSPHSVSDLAVVAPAQFSSRAGQAPPVAPANCTNLPLPSHHARPTATNALLLRSADNPVK